MGAHLVPRTAGPLVALDSLHAVDVRPARLAIGHFVTDEGRVLSAERGSHTVRERRYTPNRAGYLMVYVASAGRNVAVHCLVAEAFLGPKPTPNHEVRHLDGDCTNNRPENLAWGTHQENIDDRERHGTTARGARNGAYTRPETRRAGELNGNAVLTGAQVADVRQRLAVGERRADVARSLGVKWNVVDRIARGLTWRGPIAEEDTRRGSTNGAADSNAA